MKELSMDDLNKTAGGGKPNTPNAPDDFYLTVHDGSRMNAGGACEVLRAVYNQYGLDTAIEFASEHWVMSVQDWSSMIRAGGPEYAVQMIWGKFYKSKLTGRPVG